MVEHQRGGWTEIHANRIWHRIETEHSSISLEVMNVSDILPKNIIPALRAIEQRGALDLASRMKANYQSNL